jgi:hypothetical protein
MQQVSLVLISPPILRRQQPPDRRFPAPQALSRLPAREAPVGDGRRELIPHLRERRVIQPARPPDGFALGARPFQARGHPFANEFQFKLRQAGQQVQEQPAQRGGGVESFLGAQKPNVQRFPDRQGIVHVLHRAERSIFRDIGPGRYATVRALLGRSEVPELGGPLRCRSQAALRVLATRCESNLSDPFPSETERAPDFLERQAGIQQGGHPAFAGCEKFPREAGQMHGGGR